jgi:ferredoxin-nitrite reductase
MKDIIEVSLLRNKKKNKIEAVKSLKNPMQAYEQLAFYAQNGYESIPDEDKKYFLKCFGIFDKDALTPKQFMMRVRVSGGHLNASQADTLGKIAKDYGNDYLDITTRAQVELRYLNIEDIPEVIKKLEQVGLTSYQTGVDNFRNIVTDPLDRHGFDNILPSFELLKKIQDKFLLNPDWISVLPRKFNTGISGSTINRCNVFGHDCCFVLAQKDGIYGYNMYLGGKVGVVAKDANIFLKDEEEVLAAFNALIELFREYGFRDNRNKNRLFYLIKAVGMEVLSSAIRTHCGIDFQTAGDTLTATNSKDSEYGKVQLKEGSFGVHVVVPSGIFTGSDLIKVAKLADEYGNSEVRFTVEQNIYILGVKDTKKLLEDDFFKKYKNIHSAYFNNLIACAGTKHCAFGVIENKEDAIAMSQYLSENVPLESGQVRMYWSACVKGCGTHEIADIGFEGCKAKIDGKTEDGVHITLGGKIGSDAKNGYTVLKSAPLRFAHLYLESLMLEYRKLRTKNESFEHFNDRVLLQYSPAYIGFYIKLQAYLRDKQIDVDLNINSFSKTGKNEEFEIFELGRKLYYKFANKEPYTAYNRFTNENPREKLVLLSKEFPKIDDSLDILISKMLCDEKTRAVVFSELTQLIELF